jgi:dipeptidyl aminopeptidase/acylaminoacyl peptidase
VSADDRDNDAESPLPPGPDFKEVLSLEGAGDPRISPDGSAIIYSVSSTDWENNRYDSEIWLARSAADPFQLTRTKNGSSGHARWTPDGKWIAFVADRGDDTQIWLINPAGGEARALTGVEDGVSSFEWSPDGKQMAVTITDPLSKERKKAEKTYGEFAVEDAEFRMTHLWVLDVALALEGDDPAKLPKEQDEDDDDEAEDDDEDDDGDQDEDEEPPSAFRRLTKGDAFTVNTFRWSPDGNRIVFDHTPDSRVESFSHSDISIVDVSSGEVTKLIDTAGPDDDPYWSPDGKWILFETADGEPAYYLNEELAKVPADGGDRVILTEGFDEDPGAVAWLADGIRFIAMNKTHRKLYRMDPQGGAPEVVIDSPRFIWSVSFSKDGKIVAYSGEGGDTMTEIYRQERGTSKPVQITQTTEQTADWSVGSREIVQWRSRDGATIEGVLLKPDEFDPAKEHPLLVIIHGGPAWLSYPARVYRYVYPVQQWLAKGAVILMPNYRGSTGYGEAFRSLNVRNLGVGDAWDVVSGVDYLIEQGFVDPERMGAMGWSQGGYISAFLTTTTDRFQAISVGAGISNWMTYYVNTDIHPFTRHYLKGTPWNDPEVYAKTSPMTYINDAGTPTLIQHGEFDRRVPTPNAYELFQGLQDVGVTTELIIYKGFGHGISKPKERLAAVWHNWQWFARYVWDEEVEIP